MIPSAATTPPQLTRLGLISLRVRFRTTMPFKCTEKPLRNQLSSIVTSTISSPFLLWIASSIARWI
jgi:hypothetical protein